MKVSDYLNLTRLNDLGGQFERINAGAGIHISDKFRNFLIPISFNILLWCSITHNLTIMLMNPQFCILYVLKFKVITDHSPLVIPTYFS